MTTTHADVDYFVESAMYWRDYVVLPLLGFILTSLVIIATGSILYPLIGYIIAMTIVWTVLVRQQIKYNEIRNNR